MSSTKMFEDWQPAWDYGLALETFHGGVLGPKIMPSLGTLYSPALQILSLTNLIELIPYNLFATDTTTTLQALPIKIPRQKAASRMSCNRLSLQCWEHGCNGRQFSTPSNLFRHQREKSGKAIKPECPYCRTKFTRATARNNHVSLKICRRS
jgi:hypothetical protein